jgi:hypothetical protein
MNDDQPETQPQTDLERYYEAFHMLQISKPGSVEERYWKERVAELERVTILQIKH